jgi:hypothetical protein
MNQNEVLCNIKYEQLKFDARKPEFGFTKQYTAYEKELRLGTFYFKICNRMTYKSIL